MWLQLAQCVRGFFECWLSILEKIYFAVQVMVIINTIAALCNYNVWANTARKKERPIWKSTPLQSGARKGARKLKQQPVPLKFRLHLVKRMLWRIKVCTQPKLQMAVKICLPAPVNHHRKERRRSPMNTKHARRSAGTSTAASNLALATAGKTFVTGARIRCIESVTCTTTQQHAITL